MSASDGRTAPRACSGPESSTRAPSGPGGSVLRVPYLDYGVGLGEIEVEAERWQVISKYTRDSEELETPLGVLHTSESACWVEDLWPPGRRNRQT